MESESNRFTIMNDFVKGGTVSADTFIGTFTGGAKPATAIEPADTQIKEEEISVVPDVAPDTQPLFPADDKEKEIPEPVVKKWTKAEMSGSLEMYLNFRSMLQNKLLTWYSGAEDGERFELTEEQMEHLARVYAPYFAKFGDQIPDWLWLVLAEGMIMWPIFADARKERALNKSNKEAMQSPALQQAVGRAVAFPTVRKKYQIDTSGYYMTPPTSSAYLKAGERTVKANLADIENLMRDNDVEIILKAFPGIQLPEVNAEQNA